MHPTLGHMHNGAAVSSSLNRGPKLRFGTETGLTRFLKRLVSWHERARQRRALAELEEHLLEDIGLEQTEVEEETGKPFWR